jgi:hypothetical protein
LRDCGERLVPTNHSPERCRRRIIIINEHHHTQDSNFSQLQ